MGVVCVIPARYASTRFPGKPLADLGGKPLIQWVYERAREASTIDTVYVATDDERIAAAVKDFGGNACMTSTECHSGTDRIAEAVGSINGDIDIVVNVQGDEPLISPRTIDATVNGLLQSPECMVSTPAVPINAEEAFTSPHVVKVVFDVRGVALYFSRSPIPSSARRTAPPEDGVYGYKHLGLYVYRREILEQFSRMPPARLEETEKLEQLRLLENGVPIKVVAVEEDSSGIDTPDELASLRQRLLKK